MLTCVIRTRIGTNEKSMTIQSHTFPTSVVVGVGSLQPIVKLNYYFSNPTHKRKLKPQQVGDYQVIKTHLDHKMIQPINMCQAFMCILPTSPSYAKMLNQIHFAQLNWGILFSSSNIILQGHVLILNVQLVHMYPLFKPLIVLVTMC